MNCPNFGQAAPVLEANGFQPIPITLPNQCDPNAGKRPAIEHWQHPRSVAELLPRYGRFGTGILTAVTPAVDVDVRVLEVAEAIDHVVLRVVGDAPIRIGRAPKRLRLCRTLTSFSKLATPEYTLPGDKPTDKPHKVEVLGDGQQFVAFGIHPDTGHPYHWLDFSPLDLERQDLPELTAGKADEIVAEADQLLRRAGGRIRSRSAGTSKPASLRQPGPPPRPARSLAEARQVLEALRRIDPNRLDYDGWVRVGFGLKAALPEYGRELWLAWSGKSEKDQPEFTARTWGWIKPQRCGWRYLLKLAEEVR